MNPVQQFAEVIRQADSERRPLRFRGGGTKDFYGQSLEGELFDTRAYAGIIAYDPTELVVTARCGTPLAEVEAALGERGQMLAFEPPHFAQFADGGASSFATLGGMVAAGLSGPRRASAGAVRDFVLGAKLMDGRGEALAFGGQVMKNVAGYDVSRLMAGSLGTLALILEVSLKTLPRPAVEATLRLEMPEERAIEAFNRWSAGQMPTSATVWSGGEVLVRLSGSASAVRAAAGKIGGERLDDAEGARFWESVREQTDPFFKAGKPLWRLSVPPATPPAAIGAALPGERLIEWGGALRWLASSANAHAIREAAVKAGGHASLFRAEDKSAGAFQPLAPVLEMIHRKLKASFDPRGIFNPGRMYADL